MVSKAVLVSARIGAMHAFYSYEVIDHYPLLSRSLARVIDSMENYADTRLQPQSLSQSVSFAVSHQREFSPTTKTLAESNEPSLLLRGQEDEAAPGAGQSSARRPPSTPSETSRFQSGSPNPVVSSSRCRLGL